MNFTHLIVLKTSPFYIYCADEDDAINQAKRFDVKDVIGIVFAHGGLELLELKVETTLQAKETKQIPMYVKVDSETIQEMPEDADLDELSSDELNEILDN